MAFQPAPLPAIGHLMDVTGTNASTGYYTIDGWGPLGVIWTELLLGRRLSAAHGSYTLTGQDSTLTKAAAAYLNPAPLPMQSFLFAGTATNRILPALHYGFVVTGQEITFRKGRSMSAATGYITATGAPAERDIEMDPQRGLYTFSGQDALLRRGYTLVGGAAVSGDLTGFVISGQQAGLVREDPANKVLDANTGMFVLTVNNDNWAGTGLKTERFLYADYGTFTFTGQAATITAPIWRTVVKTDDVWVQVTTTPTTWTSA